MLRFIADFNRFKRLKRDCFLDMLVPGTMAALVGVDGDKQVTITQVRWEEFFYDPQARRADFKDARYLGVCQMDVRRRPDGDVSGPRRRHRRRGRHMGVGARPGHRRRELPGPADRNIPAWSGWVDRKQRRLMVVEMYYREGGWKRCVFTGADVLEEGASPYLDHKGEPDCPIEAMSAYVKRDNSRYGAVWDMIGLQDEINKRRAKALQPLTVQADRGAWTRWPSGPTSRCARAEAARPDGVLPLGWKMSPQHGRVPGQHGDAAGGQGARSSAWGRTRPCSGATAHDASGRALLARQQSGLIELSNLYGALEDWELRVYRQCWARAKQYWTAPQFIRVTDDEDAPEVRGAEPAGDRRRRRWACTRRPACRAAAPGAGLQEHASPRWTWISRSTPSPTPARCSRRRSTR